MSIRFDSLKFQNNTQYGINGPILAEVGVIVDNLPPEDPEYVDTELPIHVEEGYYYVAMICRQDPSKNTFDLDKDKRYVVSRTSVYEYIFGFTNEDEMPDYLEDYQSISDAVDSDFLDFFLFENSLVQESIQDRAVVNYQRREKAKNYGEGITTIKIESLNNFQICTHLTINDTEEIVHEILLNEESNGNIFYGFRQMNESEERTVVFPEQNYFLYESGKVKAHVPILEYLYRSNQEYFPAFAKTEKTTRKNVLLYFEQHSEELETRFSKRDIEDLKSGILGYCLGIKEYRI